MFLDSLPPPEKRLQLTDTFHFSCHKDLSCFNRCCRNKHLPLTPYDVLRIKNALSIHSDDFLAQYVVYRPDPSSGFPVLSLKMGDGERLCPFVDKDGCRVYNDRPTACRLFPLGRSSGIGRDGTSHEEFFYLLDTPDCEGIEEKRAQSVEEWRDGQGLLPYIEMNDRILEIVFHPEKDPSRPLDQRQQQKVMVACYNVDMFREFVFNTRFLELYRIDKDTRNKAMEDDIGLLTLGFSYLKKTLYA